MAQELTPSYLEGLGDEELLDLFDKVQIDSVKAEKVARVYLNRAREERDTIKMARGYDRLAQTFNPKRNVVFADSVIYISKHLNNITYPAQGYLIRGYYKYDYNDLIGSFKDYMMAYEIAKRRNNVQQQAFLMGRLVYMQIQWGDQEKALNLQKKRHALITKDHNETVKKATREGKKSNLKNYKLKDEILSFGSFAYCFLTIGKIDSARVYMSKRKEKMDLYGDLDKKKLIAWSLDAMMEIEYQDGNYEKALKYADSISDLKSELSIYYKLNSGLFSGLSLVNLGDSEEGLSLLRTTDSINNLQDRKELSIKSERLLYEGLYRTYKEFDNLQKQIEYLDRIISVDSIIKKNYLDFEPKRIREFETPLLLEEKQQLIDSLEQKGKRNTYLQWGGGVMLLTAFVFLGYYYRRQRLFQQRFEALMQTQAEEAKPETPKNTGESLEIDTEIVNQILNGLERFEEKKKFTDPKLTLNNLAKRLGTNANYLSRIINYKKGKGFSQYLSDLRLEYCIAELLPQELYRKFTIKAIAEECGFKNGESFSRSFYKKYGIYPSFYIKNLNKNPNA